MQRDAKRERIDKLEKTLRRIIKYTQECSDPEGWLAFNVRFASESELGNLSSLIVEEPKP